MSQVLAWFDGIVRFGDSVIVFGISRHVEYCDEVGDGVQCLGKIFWVEECKK